MIAKELLTFWNEPEDKENLKPERITFPLNGRGEVVGDLVSVDAHGPRVRVCLTTGVRITPDWTEIIFDQEFFTVLPDTEIYIHET